jgi:hypothetical protein
VKTILHNCQTFIAECRSQPKNQKTGSYVGTVRLGEEFDFDPLTTEEYLPITPKNNPNQINLFS